MHIGHPATTTERRKVMGSLVRLVVGLFGLMAAVPAAAFDPTFSLLSKGISTAMDVRSRDDVEHDIWIDLALTRKLLVNKGDAYTDISVLVFARHAVLVGFAKNRDIRRQAVKLAKTEKRLRSLKNAIVVGATDGNIAINLLLDKKIDLVLIATQGVGSVNMRWKVYAGDVFLMGVAQSRREANLAVRTIKELHGVKKVHSSLRIGKRKK